MEFVEVESKAVRSIGYDPEKQVLEIEFRRGKRYQYYDVSPSTHAWLLRARNKGAFVKGILNQHSYREVTPEPEPQDLVAALAESIRRTRKR